MDKGNRKKQKPRVGGKGPEYRLAAENFCLWMLISQEGLLDEAREFMREYMDMTELFVQETYIVHQPH